MVEAGLRDTGAGLVSREEGRMLLAESGIIPPEWTEAEEEVESTDTETARSNWRERLLEKAGVQSALSTFPAEPIVSYRWPLQRTFTVWDPERARRSFRMSRKPQAASGKKRQADSGEDVLYENEKQDFTITEADVDRAIDKARKRAGEEVAEALEAPEVPIGSGKDKRQPEGEA
jgi:hypothetical protein